MKKFITDITAAIGETPLLRLDKIKAKYGFDGEIYAKLEHLNPSFSKKDRIGLGMIELAEKSGELKKGQTVIETTSGNTGTSLALVCAAKGYKFIAVMSAGNTVERKKMIEAFGGEVVLVPQSVDSTGKVTGDDLQKVEDTAEALVKQYNAFYVNQFHNSNNPKSQEPVAKEIYEQTDGAIDAFADFGGTGGTFAGISKGFKDLNKDIKCYMVEPYGCAYYKDELIPGSRHTIQGGGYARNLDIVDKSLIDGCVVVTDEETVNMARELSKIEGIFGGFSAGANLAAAIKLLEGELKGKKIAIIVNDTGLKYMSTSLY